MMDLQQLRTLLAQVVYHKHYNGLEGLTPIRSLLEKDHEGDAARFLNTQLPALPDKIRGGIAFALAEQYRKAGDLTAIRALYASEDAEVQESVLNGLWGEPDASAEMGPGIVALAVEGMRHPAPQVRTEASYVIQNQSAWNVDVTAALEPLRSLLHDPVSRVRHQAAYAVGNIAKGKYDLTEHLPALIGCLRHEDMFVREASAWALWKLSSRRYDIAPAIADLVHLLTSPEDFSQLRKSAAGALLHHARTSSHNRHAVQQQAAATPLDTTHKEIARFLQQLTALGQTKSA